MKIQGVIGPKNEVRKAAQKSVALTMASPVNVRKLELLLQRFKEARATSMLLSMTMSSDLKVTFRSSHR